MAPIGPRQLASWQYSRFKSYYSGVTTFVNFRVRQNLFGHADRNET